MKVCPVNTTVNTLSLYHISVVTQPGFFMAVDPSEIDPIRFQRFNEFLREMEGRGMSQAQVAVRLELPPQYLSDVKKGRRTLTELFARRIACEFQEYDYQWFLGVTNSKKRTGSGGNPSGDDVFVVPILSELVLGNPQESTLWDGSRIDLVGTAALRAKQANQPYVLRFAGPDSQGELKAGDQLLISQTPKPSAGMQVVAYRSRLYLARLAAADGDWQRVSDGKPLSEHAEAVAHCLGITWRAL
jgi:transcriptional regulator with XRE-family HTH domain